MTQTYKRYWHREQLSKIWNNEYKNLEYVSHVIPKCVKVALTDNKDQQTIGKIFDSYPHPQWLIDIENMMDYKNIVSSVRLLEKNDVIPKHKDFFENYYPNIEPNNRRIYTILIMLDDWKSGHYLEINNQSITFWKAGAYFIASCDANFTIANIGNDNFYYIKMAGTSNCDSDIKKTIHFFNFPDIESKKETFSPHFAFKLQSYVDVKNPYFVYMSDGYIKDLDKINHDKTTIDSLNKTGVDFFLHKPLCNYYLNRPNIFENGETKHTQWNYSEFHHTDDLNNIRSDELDSILNYTKRNSLTKVNVNICERTNEKIYLFYKDKINIISNNTVINKSSLPPVKNTNLNTNFSKKFISINWRHTPNRHLVAAYLCQLSTNLSWYFTSDFEFLSKEIWYDLENWRLKDPDLYQKIFDGIKYLNKNAPYCLDISSSSAARITHTYYKQTLPDMRFLPKLNGLAESDQLENFYADSFCDIITEDRFAQPTAIFTERTLIPMLFKKPFIMVGPPHTLKYLKELGFRTFDQIWEETYDDIEDHELRLKTIFKILDDINECKIEFLKEIYMNASDILEHNYNKTIELLGMQK